MDSTSVSLLQRLQNSGDDATWQKLHELYAPLLRNWLQRYDVQSSDADDLTQEVLLAVAKDLPAFEHVGRTGAFRSWLRSILVNRLRHFWRSRGRQARAMANSDVDRQLQELQDPASALSQLWDQQHDQHVAERLLAIAEPDFAPQTWRAFCRVAIDGANAQAVAAELGISLNAVFIAKSRVLTRLRRDAIGLIESSTDFSQNR